MKTCVTEILKAKGPSVYTTDRNTTVFAAIERMEELRVGCLVVTEGDEVCGIVTERDYLRQIAIKGRSSRTTNVGEIMSYPVVCAHVEDTVEHCMAVMTEKRCRHLPVIGPAGLAGLLSIGDLVKHVAAAQKAEIRWLHDYIQGKYPG